MSELECNEAFPVKNKGNESNKELIKAFSPRNISINRNGGRHHLPGLVIKDDLDTSQRCCPISVLCSVYQIGTILHAGNHAFFVSKDVFMTLL